MTLIRLKDLNAFDVREDLRIMLTRQIRLIRMLCDDHIDPELNEETRDILNALTSYAQTGEPVVHGKWGILDRVLYSSTVDFTIESETWPKTTAMQELENVLPPARPLWTYPGRDPVCAIECVLRACDARDMLAAQEKNSIPVGYIATLSSLPVATMRVYASREHLMSGTPGEMDPDLSVAWLRFRGVPGPWMNL